jgi:putative endonuclease
MPERDPDRHRRRTELRGRSAETLALVALMLKGYRPLGSRFRAAGVEVKARATLEAAQGAIDARKVGRFSRAARAWISRHPGCSGATFRADAVFVSPRAWPRHVPDAFPIA